MVLHAHGFVKICLSSSSMIAMCTYIRYAQASSSVPTWLDNLRCSTSDTSLESCSHNGIGVEDCGHSEDIALSCFKSR